MYKSSVCVIGLGYVGLPTACLLADKGYLVYGMDNNSDVINNIEAADCLRSERELFNLLKKVMSTGALQLSTQITQAKIYIIAVPTPLNDQSEPDISQVENVCETLKSYVKPGDLIIIESTCPIGTTNKLAKILSAACHNLYIAYCPERMMPGNALYELTHNHRVIGGINAESASYAGMFFKSFLAAEISYTDTKTAEAVKLAENTYRDVNIAYANELSMIAEKVGIDVRQLISLANKHSRVNILDPGIGVGGHCIAVDPYFLCFPAEPEHQIIPLAREINNTKTQWVINKISAIAAQHRVETILCLGITYKPNVGDIRNSPALKIVVALEREFIVHVVDPYITGLESLRQVMKKADMVVTLVAHTEFLDIYRRLPERIIYLDYTGQCQ